MKAQKRSVGGYAGILALLVSFYFILPGCASIAVNQRLQEYANFFNPLMDPTIDPGTVKQEVIRLLGPPAKKEIVGDSEFWFFRKSYGARGTGYYMAPNPYNPYLQSGFVSTGSAEAYDEITLEFNSRGRLLDWRAYVQR